MAESRANDGAGGRPELSQQQHSTQYYLAPEGIDRPREEAREEEEVEDDSTITPPGADSSGSEADGYVPINPGDRDQLKRLASQHSRSQSIALSRHTTQQSNDLEKVETITGIPDDDPVFDPNHKSFDLYKWLKRFMRDLNKEDFKIARAGIIFKDLNITGSGAALKLQQNVGSLLMAPLRLAENISLHRSPEKRILKDFNGILKSGELLIVLGRPGSGCSTLLKSMCGELHGLNMVEGSEVHYNGISQNQMMKEFKGEIVYNQEVDKHFPHLTVGQTLEFAASVRTPSHRLHGGSRKEWAKNITQVIMAVYGLSHTYNTKVGNDFVRGVSGGERKRVSIAEMALAGSPLAAWDNSTRGLDSATALKFVQSLRLTADLGGTAHAVAIYQASQAIYDTFDKAIVLYEGRQIFFGHVSKARGFFERQGWYCPPRQTTGDFLTSVTNPTERKTRDGMDDKVPRTPDEFEAYWQKSEEYAEMLREIQQHESDFPASGQDGTLQQFRDRKLDQQAKHTRNKSPYMISIPMQIRLNTIRAYQRIWGDIASTATTLIGQAIMALIVGSVFYGTPEATAGFFAKGSALFFAVLLNALIAISEINALYAQRPIIEKQKSYAFYHPFTEAFAGIVSDIPVKFALAVVFNIILYFLAGLRRTPSQFFIYFMVVYTAVFVMSAVFRTLAAVTKTVSQAMSLAGVMVLILVVYTGFVLPDAYMHVWFSWLKWINPIYYAFEILIANEFHGRDFTCSQFIPGYPDNLSGANGDAFICSVVGSVPGQRTVSGDAFIAESYNYYYSHVWRNYGILWAFLIFFMVIYFVATELNSSTSSTAEVLVFRRGHVPAHLQKHGKSKPGTGDEEVNAPDGRAEKEGAEAEDGTNAIPPQKDVFTWRDVKYDIPVKEGTRTLLDNVSGWVKPGTLTALMGVSGAGKTTLLDVLAQRVSMGVVTGDMLVNGRPLDSSFQRKTGYVQQQDLHLETATVRESLRFSAELRQPKTVSRQEKYDYVEEVIKMLNMQDFAEAVVGTPGEGLNVEQRKLLTIGVELAAKPKLLLFLDEPTSGLDSQSSWAICSFLRKLANNGQAILCTIHQPSAILFQEFDRLLFLARGGKTVYFGNIGKNSRTLLDYFEANGARKCGDDENPAEYMLEIVNKGTNPKGEDWFDVWKGSNEAADTQKELDRIHAEKADEPIADEDDPTSHNEFAMPFWNQLYAVTYRVFQQYWRMPSYIIAKLMLGVASGLFIGFSFYNSDESLQGLQNIIFSIFMVSAIFSTLVQQIMPLFVTQRSLYEVRERPSKAYSWKAFLIANIFVEIPYQILLGILVFACYYYAVNGVQSSARQGLVLLFSMQFFVYASTFAHMCIAALPDAETAGSIATLLFSMMLTFNGVMQSPSALPGFWVFMYRVSPLTYWVAGIASTEMSGRTVECSSSEVSVIDPPVAGLTCQEYFAPYLTVAPGSLQNPTDTSQCRYCSLSNADQFLAGSNIYYSERWRNFGLIFAYICFNIFMAVFLYWAVRVRKPSKKASLKQRLAAPATWLKKLLVHHPGNTNREHRKDKFKLETS